MTAVQLDLLAELEPEQHRVMVDHRGDRWLVSYIADLDPLTYGPGLAGIWTHDVRARKWVEAKRRAPYWGPELSMHVNATEWTEEPGQ